MEQRKKLSYYICNRESEKTLIINKPYFVVHDSPQAHDADMDVILRISHV